MTDNKIKKLPPRRLILKLRLDSRQVTQALQYGLYTLDGKQCDFEQIGPLAGTFNFRRGDDLQIVVHTVLHEYQKSFPDFSIINGTIVSISEAARAGEQPSLSPFDPTDACTSILAWSDPEEIPKNKVFSKSELASIDKNQKIKCVQVKALQSIIVGAGEGKWAMSGYLSTLFRVDAKSYSRLYLFDPEGSVGGGTGFGPP